LHPALESFAGHGFWKKQFDGASGLFSIVLKEEPMERFAARFNALDVFRLGASWGGTHSILAPVVLDVERTVNRFLAGRKIVRISVGLEDEDGLRRDLARCFGAC
jgi:cystathionine beta-lyase